MANKSKTRLPSSLAELNDTVGVLCKELRRRAPLSVDDGGLSNMELIGAVKALESIRVQALSLLEDDETKAGDEG